VIRERKSKASLTDIRQVGPSDAITSFCTLINLTHSF
jgi:hypothetical protein